VKHGEAPNSALDGLLVKSFKCRETIQYCTVLHSAVLYGTQQTERRTHARLVNLQLDDDVRTEFLLLAAVGMYKFLAKSHIISQKQRDKCKHDYYANY
jgi:hypothetical protein